MPCVCVLVLSICRSWQWERRGLGVWFGTCEGETWDCACVCVSEPLHLGGPGQRGPLPPSPFPRPKRCTASHANIRLRLRLRVRNPHSRLLLCTRTCRMPVAATGLAWDLDWHDRTRTLSNVGSGTARASHDLTARCGEGRRLGRWCMRKPWHGVFVPTIFEARLADALKHRAEST